MKDNKEELFHLEREKFGAFLKEKRLSKGYSMRDFSARLNISATYVGDIEKGNRNPPRTNKLQEIIETLNLSQDEQITLYDLAGKCRINTAIAPDIYHYLQDNEIIYKVLRKAIKANLNEGDWQKIYDEIEKE